MKVNNLFIQKLIITLHILKYCVYSTIHKMVCKFCQQATQKASDNVCFSCLQNPTVTIQQYDIKQKYKLTKLEMAKLKHLKYGIYKSCYSLSDVWDYCEKLYKDLPANDKRKKIYLKEKASVEQLREKIKVDTAALVIKKEQLLNEAKSLLTKYNIDIEKEVIPPNIISHPHSPSVAIKFYNLIATYATYTPFDVFGMAMKVANETYNYYLLIKQILEQNKRREDIEELIKSKYNDNQIAYIHTPAVYFGMCNDYIINGKETIENVMAFIQRELNKKVSRDKRTILLKNAFTKDIQLTHVYLQHTLRVCRTYVKHGKINLNDVIVQVKNEVIRLDRHNQFMTVAFQKSVLIQQCTRWKLYKDYINGLVSIDYVTDNIKAESEMENRKKNVIEHVKTFSHRYQRCILKNYNKNKQLQEEYIEKNSISFDTVKQILVSLEEDLINNATNLSDKWKVFLINTNKQGILKCHRDVLYDNILFAFCDHAVKNGCLELPITNKLNILDKQNMLYIENRCQQLGLKCDKQYNSQLGVNLVITRLP